MSQESSHQCPRCGATLAGGSVDGLCANCLAVLNFATETAMPDEGRIGHAPPLGVEELAPHFPQLEIIECLGRGGMGVVYKARQKSLNRLVALKLLAPERANDPQFAGRFAREAQALAVLNHPNIVAIYDFGQAGGFYFLLMEFVDGVNLRQLLQAKKLTPKEALSIVPPVCDALQCAHDHGIVHRDIKPENLLIDKSGTVKIADFGIAKMYGSHLAPRDEPHVSRSETATMPFGTPDYAAPEQHDAHAALDHRADIYSLGVVLYEMLTGERPKDNIVPPSKRVQVDVRIDEIVLRALEKTPELRFATAAEFRTQVEAATSEPGTGRADARTPLFTRCGGRLRLCWPGVMELCGTLGLVVLGGNLAIALGIWLFTRQPWPMFQASELPWVFVLMAVCFVMRLAARKLNVGSATAESASHAAGNVSARLQFNETWKAPTTGWGYLVGVFFGITFTSPLAFKLANLSALGFLGFVGFSGIPELRRCLGFFGFFGLIGVAVMIELFHRKVPQGHPQPSSVATRPGAKSIAVATGVTCFFAGLLAGVPFVDMFRVHKDSAYIFVIVVTLLASLFAGFQVSWSLKRETATTSPRWWFKPLSLVAFVAALPVVGFAIFFASQLPQGFNNPTPSEALLVPLCWIGALLLPIAGIVLWHASKSDVATRHPRGCLGIVLVLCFLASGIIALGVLTLFWSYQRVGRAQAATEAARSRDEKVRAEALHGSEFVRAGTQNSISTEPTTSLNGTMNPTDLKALSWSQFDQTPGKYWRELADVRRFTDAAKLIGQYLALHPELDRGTEKINGANLHFHAAQCWALADEKENALKQLAASKHDAETPGGLLWNDYVAGTEAFLRGDRPALLSEYEKLARGTDVNKPNLAVLERLIANFGKSYADAYQTDGLDYKKLSADCFNRTWELLEKKNRTGKDNERMISLAHASLGFWRLRDDCTDRNLSIGHWQISRVYAVLGDGQNAKTQGGLCLVVSSKEPPFYLAYAHEALARAALLLKDRARFDAHLTDARSLATKVTDAEEKKMLDDDLAELAQKGGVF